LVLAHLDEPEDAADPEDPHHPEEGGRHGEVGHEVLHEDADDGSDHQDEVKEVPGGGEVVVTQTDDFHRSLCNARRLLMSSSANKKLCF